MRGKGILKKHYSYKEYTSQPTPDHIYVLGVFLVGGGHLAFLVHT